MKAFSGLFTPSIRRTISSAFLIITVLVLAMVTASYLQLRQIKPFSDLIIHNSSDLVHLQEMANAQSALDADLERFLVIHGGQYQDSVQNDLQGMSDAFKFLQDTPTATIQPDLTELDKTLSHLQLGVKQVLDAVSTHASSGVINRDTVAVYADIDKVKQLQVDLSAKTLDGLQSAAQTQGRLANNVLAQSVVFGIIVTLIAAMISLLTDRRLRAVSILTNTAAAIAAGDLTRVAPVENNDEIGTLANAFNSMTSRLRELVGSLEKRVADRTRALATSAEVSRRLSTILNRKQLVTEVVTQVQEAFGYYHAQIYFFNDAKDQLVMAGGTGQAGEMMLAQFHKVAKGRGLVGRAAENNESILVSDTTKDSNWLPNPLLSDTKSEAAIPISIGGEVLGVLDVQQDIIDGLQQEDVDSLKPIANQVAVALRNIQSTEIVAKRATELQTVATISTAAATISDVQKMLESVVHLTQRGFGLYHAHVFIYNENTETLDIVACGYKEGDEHEGTHGATVIPLQQEQSLVARSARTRQAVIVNDVHNEPGWLPNPLLPDTASELAVPLVVGNQVLGVLDVQSERVNAFTDEDASIQTTLASQVATALQNARSFMDAQQQALHETTLNTINQKIQGTTTIESALQTAARELGHALGMRQTLVTLKPSALAGDDMNKASKESVK